MNHHSSFNGGEGCSISLGDQKLGFDEWVIGESQVDCCEQGVHAIAVLRGDWDDAGATAAMPSRSASLTGPFC